MASTRISLAEQLKQISDTAPIDFDPEDAQVTNVEEQRDVNSAATEHYLDVGPSAIRKLQESVSDPKYSARRISRQELVDSDRDEDQSRDNSSDSENEPGFPEESLSEGEDQRKIAPRSQLAPTTDADDLASKIRKTREEDRLKGIAVSRQITLWDTLLDARIRLQKGFSAANRLPQADDLATFTTDADTQEAVDKLLTEAMTLSDELFQLQEHLLEKNEDIRPPSRKRRRTGDAVAFASEATQAAAELENVYHPHLVRTLAKWSSKIQSVAPSVLLPSNRNAFSKNSRQEVKNAVQLIDEACSDHQEWNKLLDRTRVWRNKGDRMGSLVMQEHDAEVFDDTDFYQQLLRDVIDSKNGGEDWMVAQKERKKKKTVDTKASKGRKLRYEVHEKLQNFMVPVPVHNGWHEEQIDELFASLLGKGFENTTEIYPEPARVEMEIEPGTYRIFG